VRTVLKSNQSAMNYLLYIHNRPKLHKSEHNWIHYMYTLNTNTKRTKTITKMTDTCT